MSNHLRKQDYELLANFRYQLRQFMRFSEQAAQNVGLTPQQHQALLAVIGYPGRDRITIGELAERLQIKHHSAVGLADRLIAQGFMVREESQDDRRQVYVRLTPTGLEMIERLSSAHRQELAQISGELQRLVEQIVQGIGQEPGRD
jgi:DNA-binding MarR family transcriptional regulator